MLTRRLVAVDDSCNRALNLTPAHPAHSQSEEYSKRATSNASNRSGRANYLVLTEEAKKPVRWDPIRRVGARTEIDGQLLSMFPSMQNGLLGTRKMSESVLPSTDGLKI